MPFLKLNNVQMDILKETSNIGMGHAATALSQMIGHPVKLRVPHVTITKISQVPEYLGGAEKMMVGITLQVLGDARGSIMLLFPQESAHRLLCNLTGDQGKVLIMNEVTISALKEVGNILSSAYLSALGSMLHKTLIPSVPLLAYDMAGAVVDYVLIDLSKSSDLAMLVETDFIGESSSDLAIKGHFFLIPDPSTLDMFLDAAGGYQ
ncbi:MAG: chemotaxis protein CheC [Deltaproteobacteria bacterium]|jgi:chemotaxis protein CheC|nr:chemotaxis protein CheC [Deltaproteobacteria bacterium]MBW2512062.1 chemotaxis protein CheC [Deltaproteobacteria bacterium]MDH4006673.1 chemotaxis protein CheC [Desulfuromonadales bacterium]